MNQQSEINLDSNATTRVLPAAVQAAVRMMSEFPGNPSSAHISGLQANAVLRDAHAVAARVLEVPVATLTFTSGATESIQIGALSALKEAARRGLAPDGCVLVGATEHKAVSEGVLHWNQVLGLGLEVLPVPVDRDGRHDLGFLRRHAARAALVCTMAANNETGAISDLDGIRAALDAAGSKALWLVDSVQGLGKLPLKLLERRVDYASFSGHKLHAPKGVGLLYIREGAPFTALMAGGGQESGRRCGTENLTGIAALGAVLAELERGDTFHSTPHMLRLNGMLWTALESAFPGLVRHSPGHGCLPTTLNFSVPGLSGKQMMDAFDAAGVRVSGGSACSARKSAPSYVLLAMGIPEERAASAIRMSFSPLDSIAHIEAACQRIGACGAALASLRQAALSGAEPDRSGSPLCGDNPPPAEEPEDAAIDPKRLGWGGDGGYVLVDVREDFEHVLDGAPLPDRQEALRLPLSQLGPQLEAWAAQPSEKIVFLCRSGKRSIQALQCLRQLGHGQCWHIEGGLALWRAGVKGNQEVCI